MIGFIFAVIIIKKLHTCKHVHKLKCINCVSVKFEIFGTISNVDSPVSILFNFFITQILNQRLDSSLASWNMNQILYNYNKYIQKAMIIFLTVMSVWSLRHLGYLLLYIREHLKGVKWTDGVNNTHTRGVPRSNRTFFITHKSLFVLYFIFLNSILKYQFRSYSMFY